MATFTLTTTPGAAYIGTEGDDTFIALTREAWIAAGRTIDGRGGTDTLVLAWLITGATGVNVNDAEFAGVSNLEALTWSGTGGSFPSINLGAQASASFANGVAIAGYINLFGQGLTVPVSFYEGGNASVASVRTGSANDVIRTISYQPAVDAGPGDDRIYLLSPYNSPFTGGFAGSGGSVQAGTGYDIIIGVGPGDAITATAQCNVTGVEEIWTSTRFNLLATTPTALTGLDADGNRNPLVLRPDGAGLNIYASDDGRPSYDGRIIAYGGAGNDTVRGSSTGDLLDGGSGGADFLSGEGGDDRIVVQNAAQLAASSIAGGAGYDILSITDAHQLLSTAVLSHVTGIEEIWGDGLFSLRDTMPTALTGLDSSGARNPLVLRPNGAGLNVLAGDVGGGAYDGRLIAYGAADIDSVTGSSTGDLLDGGSGGRDNLSGEGGNDWLVFQNAAHASQATLIAGGAGYDILALKDASQNVTDAAFAKAQGIEELRLLGGGEQAVTLGANSDAAFAASSFGAGSVSAPGASRLTLNATATSTALSIYGAAVTNVATGEGRDYIEINSSNGASFVNSGVSFINAGGGADHVRFNAMIASGSAVDGGAGYDVLMLNNAALFGLSLQLPLPFIAPIVRGFEELRLMGEGAISITLTDRFPGLNLLGIPPSDRFIFSGSETGYGTIQAPNASSLTINLRDLTIGISLYGTPGNDVITATATANDFLAGGAGADIFRFDRQCGVDVVADFVSGTDKLALIGFAGITDFAAVQAHAAVVAGNLQIGLSPTDAVILAGVTSIAAGDFLFG